MDFGGVKSCILRGCRISPATVAPLKGGILGHGFIDLDPIIQWVGHIFFGATRPDPLRKNGRYLQWIGSFSSWPLKEGLIFFFVEMMMSMTPSHSSGSWDGDWTARHCRELLSSDKSKLLKGTHGETWCYFDSRPLQEISENQFHWNDLGLSIFRLARVGAESRNWKVVPPANWLV